jgi:serine/threonine-protein kinase
MIPEAASPDRTRGVQAFKIFQRFAEDTDKAPQARQKMRATSGNSRREEMNTLASYDAGAAIGMTVGGATILKELARGNMGIVFTAFQRSLKRPIAVKILPKCMYTAESIRLFEQEAEAVAGLSHPNIVPIYEIGETHDFRYFTMQLIDGAPLSALLRNTARNPLPSRRILPLRTALSISRQVLEALEYAHRRGVVHRDIKPENILVVAGSRIPVITDFGISRIVAADADALVIPRGSPLYMAPEQIAGSDCDARADVHAAGVLLFRLLVEKLPLVAYSVREDILKRKLAGRPIFASAPSKANPRLSPEMDEIIACATAHAPDGRYASCRDFLGALDRYEQKHLTAFGRR